jgi:hypothetical protein
VSNQTVPVDETSSSWLFRVGSGVELHGTYGSLTASGGFAADIIASNYKYVPLRGADVRLIIDSPFREARLTLPAIAYIEVYRDIRFFGGAIFSASYSYDKESVLLPAFPAEEVPLTINTNTTVSVTTRYPIGILADHPAGFFLEAAFGGSLASYDTWRLTLGLDLD